MTKHEKIDETRASATPERMQDRPRARDPREAAFVDVLTSGEDAPGTDLVIKGAKLFLVAAAAFVVVAAVIAEFMG